MGRLLSGLLQIGLAVIAMTRPAWGASASVAIAGTPASSVILGSAYSFAPTASSSAGYTLYFSIQNAPKWAAFTPSTGQISGTPTGVTGTYSNIVISASDGHGDRASLPPFSITVEDAPPTIGGTPPQSATAGEFYAFMPVATETTPLVGLTFSVTRLPLWAAFSTSTGTVSGIIPVGTSGTFTNITITVTNSAGQSASLNPFSIRVKSSTQGQSSALAFALTTPYDTPQNFDSYFSDANLDGVALQVQWANLETAPGTYIWSDTPGNSLDSVIAQAKTAGKMITLHIDAAPSATPTWLASAGAQFYSARGGSYVVPWDPVYLSEYSSFIVALAAHLAAEGYTNTIYDVSLTVPESEMNIIPCEKGMLSLRVPFDRTSYLAAWETIAAVLELSFPGQKKFLTPPANETICGSAADPTFYPDLLSALLLASDTYWMFAADLNAATSTGSAGSGRASPYLRTFLGVTGVAYQMLGAATPGGTSTLGGTYPGNLQQAVCAGLASGGQYIEIYSTDVLNSDTTIQTAIESVHRPGLCKF